MPDDDYFAWQGRRESSRQGRRHHAGQSGEPPTLQPAPPRSDVIQVQEHGTASTTLVRRIRLALFRNQRGE